MISRTRGILPSLAALALALTVGGCAGAETAADELPEGEGRDAEAREQVFRASMRDMAFAPTRIEVTAGTTVIWTNNDPVAHTVTATDRSWDSGTLEPGRTWRRTFDRPGTYRFFCVPHPGMTGVVVVRPRG